jgi:hypothetical protein
MLYTVKARFKPDRLPELYVRLMDGSIQQQKPDGEEICASMERARITAPGVVEWTELFCCPTPLQHELATVYDRFFTDMSTVEVNEHREFEGESFVELLRSSALMAKARFPAGPAYAFERESHHNIGENS